MKYLFRATFPYQNAVVEEIVDPEEFGWVPPGKTWEDLSDDERNRIIDDEHSDWLLTKVDGHWEEL